MAAAADSTNLPGLFEEIEARFFVPEIGKKVWWPATVEEIHVHGEGASTLGRGTVTYAAMYERARESKQVTFLPGYRLMEGSKKSTETSWRAVVEADEDDIADADFREGRGTKRNRAGSSAGLNGQQSLARVPSTNVPTRSGAAAVVAQVNHDELMDLYRRVTRLEKGCFTKHVCHHEELIGERVYAMRMLLRRTLLEHVYAQPRQWRRSGAPFQDVLRVSAEEAFIMSDQKMFIYLAEDACRTFNATDDVVFRPDLGMMKSQRRAQADVIFPDADAFLDWLCISTDDVYKNIKMREYTEKGTPIMRVMGSMQHDSNDASKVMKLFPGSSSSTVEGGRHSTTVTFASADWDDENSQFVHKPELRHLDAGKLFCANISSTFALSWSAAAPFKELRSNSDSLELMDIALGEIVLHYPMIWARGEDLIEKLKVLINE